MLTKAPPLPEGRCPEGTEGRESPKRRYPSVSKLTAPLRQGSSYIVIIRGAACIIHYQLSILH